ncbi:MAG: putative oxidoreductase [Patescibacteria group bacterium]|nr:putative oxidoreductase [Patescibacteria group bacterium]
MKTAVVTGASYGIGKAATDVLLQRGWKVYGLSRSQSAISNNHFVWLQCDLSKSDHIEKSLKAISEPTLDALISNAGVVLDEAASDVALASYEQTFSVNVLAPMLIVAALRDKISHATIISVSSVSDRLPEARFALYCSSKAANTLYFNALARELQDANVYTLLPDYVDTPMLRDTPPSAKDFDWDVIIQPPDIARLCGDLISGRIAVESGANIIIVTEALKESLTSVEKLYGFNTDTHTLTKL